MTKFKSKINIPYRLPAGLLFLISTYLFLLLLFCLTRFVFFLDNKHLLTPEAKPYIWYAFFNRGLLFDSIAASYFIALPSLFILGAYLIGVANLKLYKYTYYISLIFFALAVIISISDLPFFTYYNARINRNVLLWADDFSSMFKAVITDSTYLKSYAIMVLFLIFIFFILRLLYRFFLKKIPGTLKHPVYIRILVFVVVLYAYFIAIRGEYSFKKMPTVSAHAFNTPHPFINQLGINATYSFLNSFTNDKFQYLDDELAIDKAKQFLARDSIIPETSIAQFQAGDSAFQKMNIVLILMESMSAKRMSYYEGALGVSLFLDSLAQNSLFFPNSYCAGIHTHNGIFSSLFGLPALGELKTMSSAISADYSFSGLSNVLSNHGYKSIYMSTTSQKFDNVGAFLKKNNFDIVIDEAFFKEEDVVDCWGVGDHTLFSDPFPLIDSIAEESPFFGVYMTISTHTPYFLPEGIDFIPKTHGALDQIYEYADWSLQQFFAQASTKAWYNNTLFVLVADHGQNFDATYEMPLAYNHVPLLFYSPKHISSKIDERLALQIDIPATVFSLLGLPYVNNTLGVDLLSHKRPFAYFSADKNTACLNKDFYYFKNSSGLEYLYDYKSKSLDNYIEQESELVKEMKEYTYSMLQTTQFMIYNNQTSLP